MEKNLSQDSVTILTQNIFRREGTRIWIKEGDGTVSTYDTRFYKITEREG